MPLSTAVRTLVAERVQEIDEASELGVAEKWQRAQAWRDREKVQSGQMIEVTRQELMAELQTSPSRRTRRAPKRRR